MRLICIYCGEAFQAERRSAKFCNSAHRTAFHRLSVEVESRKQAVLDALQRLDELQQWSHLVIDVDKAYSEISNQSYRQQKANYRRVLKAQNEMFQNE